MEKIVLRSAARLLYPLFYMYFFWFFILDGGALSTQLKFDP